VAVRRQIPPSFETSNASASRQRKNERQQLVTERFQDPKMMNLNESSPVLRKIIADAQDYFDLVERLSKAPTFNAADYKDAYARLTRVRNRYEDEKTDLLPSERQAL